MDKKKKILTIITFSLFIVVFFLAYLLFQKYGLKGNFEKEVLSFAQKNETTIFEVKQIVMFSNCDAKNKTSSANHYTLENLYQYTDIALFLSSPFEEKTLENTLKKVKIKEIKWNQSPSIGEPNLYFKGLPQFAKNTLVEENKLEHELDFTITKEAEANLETPTLYNNLANPITLSYVNQNIKTDYTITDTSSAITYDGSLLKRCNISLESLSCDISFEIEITNQLDQTFKSTIHLKIPLQTEGKSLYDGTITKKQDTQFSFYRY